MNAPIRILATAALSVAAACSGGGSGTTIAAAQSCMGCHNGSQHDDYSGPGIENPHPFPGADNLQCTTCHGGDPNGVDKDTSHVPPPPQIGDRAFQATNALAYFNKLTLAGMDKFPDYTVNGRTWTSLEYLQFLNPSDLRVATQQRGCGMCHVGHATALSRMPIATTMGIFSGASFATGQSNTVAGQQGLFGDTAADMAFRAVTNPNYVHDPDKVGEVGQLVEAPVWSVRGQSGAGFLFNNQAFNSAGLADDVNPDGSLISGSPMAKLYQEQVSFTCGDCHLGSSGANNRYGDFRPSGCAACHMPYSLSGRTGSSDPNVPQNEPLDPDDIDEPERAHVASHRIRGVARTLANGVQLQGIGDHTCAGCHQGSNRMVQQYWGNRLDQNQDLRFGFQYPAQPARFRNTAQDTRLFDPAVGNNTFNGRNANQYISFEDYDGDDRDDTPEDIHYEAGMGCVDCHGSVEIHGNVGAANGGDIVSRMGHAIAIRCESCHGSADAYATTAQGLNYQNQQVTLAVDSKGRVLRHVEVDANGDYWLTSRLTGNRHYIWQTRDAIVDNGKLHPITGAPLYSAKASYAMGRDDGNAANGTGPHQTGMAAAGFSHMDNMECSSCHASWSVTCVGCHLEGEYNNGNNFSNITGQRIVYRQKFADFTYQHVVPFQLGVGPKNKIMTMAANTKVFFRYNDLNGARSQVFAFSDRRGGGNNPARPFPSLGHNTFTPHSIRGRVTSTKEGLRYCNACHLTTTGLATYATEYSNFRTAMANDNFAGLDFNLLRTHIGLNTGNRLDSPLWVHMVAGLGSGIWLFDQNGAAQNPLDSNVNRFGSEGQAPSSYFTVADVRFNLDKLVDATGVSQGSSNIPMFRPVLGPNLRDGALDPDMAGPLGATLLRRLTDPVTGIVLNSWIDADGALRGDASLYVQ
jgi:hypothetical protein